MQDVTRDNFGLLIAYILPGFVVLWGVCTFSATVRGWVGVSSAQSPTVGGFLYVTVAAVAVGMVVSTIRWLIVDRLHQLTGIPLPKWNFTRLGDNLSAFDLLVDSHYRFYQFHANMLVAVAFTFFAYATTTGLRGQVDLILVGSFVIVEVILWVGSRDTLRKYYERTYALMNVDDDNVAGESLSLPK
ncbi:MAG: hypothetical protein JWP89_1629 [Schlesneria sp.]|nr:hypothetical protein [Schlesneria sp.]